MIYVWISLVQNLVFMLVCCLLFMLIPVKASQGPNMISDMTTIRRKNGNTGFSNSDE